VIFWKHTKSDHSTALPGTFSLYSVTCIGNFSSSWRQVRENTYPKGQQLKRHGSEGPNSWFPSLMKIHAILFYYMCMFILMNVILYYFSLK
jgi:hypothetical protein